MRIKLLFVLLVLCGLPSHAEVNALSRDGVGSIVLSPDGQHIAVMNRVTDTDSIVVIRVRDAAVIVRNERISPDRVHDVGWIDDANLVVQLASDIPYEVEPQRTGDIELVDLQGAVTSLTVDDASPLAESEIYLVDPLPLSPDAMLVQTAPELSLRLVDTELRVFDTIKSPQLTMAEFAVSPNLQYLVASGIDESSSRQVLALDNVSGDTWTSLDPALVPLSVNNNGTVYGLLEDESGIAGLVEFSRASDEPVTLFRDPDQDVDDVLFDSDRNPYAVRFQAGYPSWQYVGAESRLSAFHKSLRAGLPDTDVTFVSTNVTDSRAIARVTYESKPKSYFLINFSTGQAQNLLNSQSGLYVSGGNEADFYTMQPFTVQSEIGEEVSGFVTSPKDASLNPFPTVVYLQDALIESGWTWGFDAEISYLNSQGINVLMVNQQHESVDPVAGRAIDLATASQNVEDAIRWSIENNFSDPAKICVLGRGSGAETALLVAIRNPNIECAISFGGLFRNLGQLSETVGSEDVDTKDLDVHFVYGSADSDYTESQLAIRESLSAAGIGNSAFVVAGENRLLSQQRNQVRALASIGSFLVARIRHRGLRASLPMTYEQAVAFREVIDEFMEKAGIDRPSMQRGLRSITNAKNWLYSQNRSMREQLSEEQFPLYERLLEIVSYTRGTASQPSSLRPSNLRTSGANEDRRPSQPRSPSRPTPPPNN